MGRAARISAEFLTSRRDVSTVASMGTRARAASSVFSWAAAALLASAACGKSSKDQVAEPKTTETAVSPTNHAAGGTATHETQAAPHVPGHPVYSFVDNRLSAHLQRGGGLVVPAGSAGFAKYIRIGNVMKGWKAIWELRQTEGDARVARMVGKAGSVYVPLTAEQAGRAQLRVRAFSAEPGTLSIRINDHKDVNAQLAQGWSTADFTVPAGELVAGENSLELFASHKGLELAWLQVGADKAAPDDGALKFYDAASRSLVVPDGGGMVWYVAVPEHASLAATLGDPACKLAAHVLAEDGQAAAGDLGSGALDLAALAGKAARVELDASGCPTAHVTDAALVLPGDAPKLHRGDAPKDVLFVVMDALRADRIRAFDPKARPETPRFTKLAETSAVFMDAYVQGNESQVSHASIWSSNYLAKHHAIEMHDKLADKWTTIDEVAKAAGKYVAGASGNGFIRPSRGFGHAWDQFSNHIEKSLGLHGEDIIEHGLSFVEPRKDRPWFLYLGLIDTHVTYRAKQPWLDQYDPGYKGRFDKSYGDDGPGGAPKDMTDREKQHVIALYDSNVSYQDDQLGKLIDKLKAWGVWDQTMLIVVADHGEELWEDGKAGHGGSEHETLLHVPLIIHYPPLFPAGKVTEGVEGIDIVPTIADALGVPTDPEWQGASLIPLAQGLGGYALMSFSSQYEDSHAGRIGHWKVKLMGPGTPHVWNLATDPGEKDNVWGKHGTEIGTRLLLDPMWLLRQWNVEWKKAQWGNADDVSSRFAADLGE